MPEVLIKSLRPTTLSGLFGQDALVKSIRNQMAARQPQSWLFFGAPGTGKTTIARIMAVSYQCTHMTVWGDPCTACYANKDEFAIHEYNVSEESGVDDMRRIAKASRHKPMNCNKRVFIMDEFQRASKDAQMLLLKPVEEPPPTTVWIFCTTDPQKILPAMRSRRSATYQLKSLDFTGREKFLTQAAATAGITRKLELLIEQAHTRAIGGPADLLQGLEKYAAGATSTEAFAGIDGAGTNSLRICKAVTSGDWSTLRNLLKDATPEDSRWIKGSVTGWLRGILLKEQDTKLQSRAADSLLDLTGYSPLDDTALRDWLFATLWQVTRRYKQ